MKLIKVYCKDCRRNTYQEVFENENIQHDTLVMCGVCGWGIQCSESDVIEVEKYNNDKHDKGQQQLINFIDSLVDMADHCNNKKTYESKKSKCHDCKLVREYGYTNSGCLLVDTIDNEEFMNVLKYTCEYNNIEYKDKLEKINSIFNNKED